MLTLLLCGKRRFRFSKIYRSTKDVSLGLQARQISVIRVLVIQKLFNCSQLAKMEKSIPDMSLP